jgi:hypothetical protein
MMLLSTRVGATRQTIDSIRKQQARSGLGLRADITAGVQRMDFYLDETETALKKGDAAVAKKALSSAEREVSNLEKFLGH